MLGIGKTYSPVSGELVKKHQVDDVVHCALGFPDGTRFALLTNLVIPEGRDLKNSLTNFAKGRFPEGRSERALPSHRRFVDRWGITGVQHCSFGNRPNECFA